MSIAHRERPYAVPTRIQNVNILLLLVAAALCALSVGVEQRGLVLVHKEILNKAAVVGRELTVKLTVHNMGETYVSVSCRRCTSHV